MSSALHFGPEWMRKPRSSQTLAERPPSPSQDTVPAAPGTSTYSALVTPAAALQPERRDDSRPFRYSREELLRIYKEGGGRGGLGLEVERWEGIVRETGSDPVAFKDMDEMEKKLFAGPINSELRRRQSTDHLSLNTSSLEKPRMQQHSASGTGSPMRERFGSFMGRRKESSAADQPTLPMPRRTSLSGQNPFNSSRDNGPHSPRNTRGGGHNNFEGVLGGTESWMARRKAADGLIRRTEASSSDSRPEIKESDVPREEDEDSISRATANSAEESKREPPAHNEPVVANTTRSQPQDQATLSQNMGNLSLSSTPSEPPTGSSPALPDLASIEWSYLDPQGNIQGPFRADVMQKWHDEGYFSPELLVRRTPLDNDWTTVRDLVQRAAGQKVFLSPIGPPVQPPGLAERRTESPMQQHEPFGYSAPHQPIPQRTLRTSALENYYGGSNPSDSPASSFGAGRFGSGSPDPAAFGGRIGAGMYSGGESSLGRNAGFIGPGGQGLGPARSTTFQEGDMLAGGRGAPFNQAPARTGTVDGFGGTFSPYNGNQSSPWPSSAAQGYPGFEGPGGRMADNFGPAVPPSPYNIGQERYLGSSANLRSFSSNDHLHNAFANGQTMNGQIRHPSYNQSPGISYPVQAPLAPTPQISHSQHNTLVSPIITQSPWAGAQEPGPRHTPFDAPHPTSSNAMVGAPPASAPIQQGPWQQAPQQPGLASPWPASSAAAAPPPTTAPEAAFNSPWPPTAAMDPPTVRNLVREVVPEGKPEPVPEPSAAPPVAKAQAKEPVETASQVVSPPPAPEPAPEPAAPTPSAPKVKRAKTKGSFSPTKEAAPVLEEAVPTPTSATPKPAWSTEDEAAAKKKNKPSGVTLGLREIQEAEAKKAEQRKAAERAQRAAKEVASPAAASSSDEQTFTTTSWGLPTSQAGKGSVTSPKETTTTSGSTSGGASPVPVWTNAPKAAPAKKSMKEILEEEERRKKAGLNQTTAAQAASRAAYATQAVKPTASTSQGAWTTVGATSKTAPTATTPAARPTMTPATSTASVTAAARPANGSARPPAVVKSVSVSSRQEEAPVQPSPEFVKWLAESLKGLKSSANIEEISSMLLSFPLDPDQSTLEIISEMIYASSTTMNGRRFATDFVAKRKSDVAARKSSQPAVAKPISIADVVKTQPKPTQPEWGGFKVVDKKKKKGSKA